ncbi:TA system antitoxin ParD family protein [Xanthomonas bonasiae]|uniref:TA system antitoxin ParD family protein n=1 Tax=Xanthomonas bonasiae TaxID=2810351 RepID=UPI00197D5C94|nr:hypothetical protein [Xanthomonas bonasiae]
MRIVDIDDARHGPLRRACTLRSRSLDAQAGFRIGIGMLCERSASGAHTGRDHRGARHLLQDDSSRVADAIPRGGRGARRDGGVANARTCRDLRKSAARRRACGVALRHRWGHGCCAAACNPETGVLHLPVLDRSKAVDALHPGEDGEWGIACHASADGR